MVVVFSMAVHRTVAARLHRNRRANATGAEIRETAAIPGTLCRAMRAPSGMFRRPKGILKHHAAGSGPATEWIDGDEMSTAAAATAQKGPAQAGDAAADAGKAKRGGKKKLVLLAIPALVAALGAGLWFGGILPPLLGMGKEAKPAGEVRPADQANEPAVAKAPIFFELPEIIANLNSSGKRASFVKLHARLEVARNEDAAAVQAAMPRLLDLFQTYLREMRPEELRGSAGTWRLREELIARASLAAAPARVVDVLFTEMLIQ
jgi:flagellar protein FliL